MIGRGLLLVPMAAVSLVLPRHDDLRAQGPGRGRPDACTPIGPVLSIGGSQSNHVFEKIEDASLLPDSGVAVLDRYARQIQLFDRSGRMVRAVGREGEGPGEFVDPIELEVSGRMITVWDWRASRLTLIDRESDAVQIINVRGQVNPTGQFGRLLGGGYAFGAMTGVQTARGEGELWVSGLGIVRTGGDGTDPDTILEIPDRITGWVDRSQRAVGGPIFGPRASMAVSAGTIWASRGDSALVLRIQGDEVGTVRWDWALRRVGRGDADRSLEELLARRPPYMHGRTRSEFQKMPVREFYPAVGGLVPDTEGGVWVYSYRRPGDEMLRWVRIDGEKAVCELEMPVTFMALEGGGNWLLGVATDQLDVQRVELWSVVQPSIGAQKRN